MPSVSTEPEPSVSTETETTDSASRGLRTPPMVAGLKNKGPGRRQQRNPEGWARNRAKVAKALGKSYTSSKTGKEMPAAKVGPPCKCQKKCFDVVGQENIDIIFKAYYDIGNDYTAKSAYLEGRIRQRAVKRRRQKMLQNQQKHSLPTWSVYIQLTLKTVE